MTTEISEVKPPPLYSVFLRVVAALDTDALAEVLGSIAGVEIDKEWAPALRRYETIKLLTAPKDLAETRAMAIANRIQTWVAKAHPKLPLSTNLFFVGVKNAN